jgi:hypothetical protein
MLLHQGRPHRRPAARGARAAVARSRRPRLRPAGGSAEPRP